MGYGLFAPVDALADPGDAGVGFDFDPQVHSVALGRRGFDRCDAHVCS